MATKTCFRTAWCHLLLAAVDFAFQRLGCYDLGGELLAARGCKGSLIIRLWINELDHVEFACYYVTGDAILEVDVVSIRFDA